MTATSAIPPVESYAPGLTTRVPDGSLSGTSNMLLGAGVIALGASAIGMFSDHAEQFYHGYLVAYMFTLSLALGALFFVIVQHLARAGWSIVVRRLAENMAATLPALLVLFLPILVDCLGDHPYLFGHWIERDPSDAVLAHKAAYLNLPFFLIRAGIYFAIWIGLATWFRNKSLEQDGNGNPELSMKMARFGAPAIILFGFSITFAAFDWVMSLNPHWFSTMFGVTYFAGSVMAFLGTLALLCMWLSKKKLLHDIVNTEHYHDIGKLMFAFMIFWSYVSFSQYFLIQYADIPEETQWFLQRQEGAWMTVGIVLVIGHFIVPFAFLLSRHMKRNRTPLAIGAVLLLVMHWFEMQFNIVPNAHHHNHFMAGWWWLDIASWLGMLGIFLGLTLRGVANTNLIPVRDPKLKESMAFQNF